MNHRDLGVSRLAAILVVCLLSAGLPAEFAAVTEVLKDPFGGENQMPGGLSHEYIEITNLGRGDLTLDSLLLSDGDVRQAIIPWTAPIKVHPNCRYGVSRLKPGEIALILDSDYGHTVDSVPSSAFSIADSTVLWTVNESSLIGGVASFDGLFLYKGTASAINRVIALFADSGATPALSGAKLRQTTPATVPEGTSIVPSTVLFGAPRYQLCPTGVSPGRFELLDKQWVFDYRALLGRIIRADSCSLAVAHPGSAAAANFSIEHADGTPAGISLHYAAADSNGVIMMTAQFPLDTVSYRFVISDGGTTIVKNLDFSPVWVPSQAIKISEIYPRSIASAPEWFEVVNTSPLRVNLQGWQFGNQDAADTLTTSPVVLNPGAYAVFTANRQQFLAVYPAVPLVVQPPHWHALDNYRDSIFLIDSHGIRRETIYYDYTWFPGWDHQSIERVNLTASGTVPAAWAIALRESPGQPNPGASWHAASAPSMEIGPIPFSPNNDGVDDLLSIRLTLPAASGVAITIYGFNGEPLKTFSGAPQQQYLWNGRTDANRVAPVGPFFVVASVQSPSGKQVLRKKGVLWR